MRRTEIGIEVMDLTVEMNITCGDVREALVIYGTSCGDPVTAIPYLTDMAVRNIVHDTCRRYGRPDFAHGDHSWPEVGEFSGDHVVYRVARDRARRFWVSDIAGSSNRAEPGQEGGPS